MATEKEIKAVQRLSTLPALVIAGFVMMFGISAVWVLCIMVDNLAFQSDSVYTIGLCVYFAIILFFVVFIIVIGFMCRRTLKSQEWISVCEKANFVSKTHYETYAQASLAGMGTATAGRSMRRFGGDTTKDTGKVAEAAGGAVLLGATALTFGAMRREAKLVAELLEIELPGVVKKILALVFIPSLLLVTVYVPEFIDSSDETNEKNVAVAEVIDEVVELFESEFVYVWADDPYEGVYSSYDIYGYLNDLDNEYDVYVHISLDDDGMLEEISYHFDIDIGKDMDETIFEIRENLTVLTAVIQKIDVEEGYAALALASSFSDEFFEAMSECGYYEEQYLSTVNDDGIKIREAYYTDTEEEFDEYTDPYVSLYVEFD